MDLPSTAVATDTSTASLPAWQRWAGRTILADRAILISTIVVASGFLLSKVLGLVREILIARSFGTSGELDAFKAASSFSDLLDSVIAGTTIAAVFIPVFSTYLVKDAAAKREGWRFASAVLNDMFITMMVLAGLGIVFAQPLIDNVLAPGFPPERSILAAQLLRIVLVSAVIFGVSGTVTGILHAQNRFALAALASPLYNLGIIMAIFALVPRYGIYGLAYGVVIGSLLHLGIQIPGLIRGGMRYSLTIGFSQQSMPQLLRLLGPRVVTTNLVQVTRILIINFASRLGVGSISALSYAYSIWQFPETLIGTAIAVAVFPRLAARAAQHDIFGLRGLYRRALLTILALAIPAAVILILFAQPIVALLLQRGAFTADSTALVASVLQFYALAVIGESLLELTARIFYAQQDSLTPMFAAIGGMALTIALMYWWREPLGAPGLALAYAVGMLAQASALAVLARKRFTVAVARQVG